MIDHQDSSKAKVAPLAALTIGAVGVVFGDIGTSPLYAFREALGQTAGGGINAAEILGVLSLMIWALILVVTVKYVSFLMRADNNGEGGVLSLMALAKRATGGWKSVIALGAVGAALFYGDAIITPALSVLSAVEGLRTLPGLDAALSERSIMNIALAILVGLFAIQSRGTANVSRLFGPVCAIWFLTIGALGLLHLYDAPSILLAFNPSLGVSFLLQHGMTGLFVLGAVFLTVTGAEALTADMGHFGRLPIKLGWFLLVFPSLVLNYLGQGAFALAQLGEATAAGKTFANADWFFLMAPEPVRPWVVVIATLATIIASQAVITGAYSLTQQAISLGLLPRLKILQTSEEHFGQIYVPVINWLLLAGVAVLIIQFRTSTSMAAAYGIAVTGTMVATTCLAFIVLWKLWNWRLASALAFIAPFLLLDLFFFGANILRVVEGGWVPLVIASIIGLLIHIWVKGKIFLSRETHWNSVGMIDLAKALSARPPRRVEGTAVFLTSEPEVAPVALLHNLKHNRILHNQNIILTVRTVTRPRVDESERVSVTPIDENFSQVEITYGYMEVADVPSDLYRTGKVLSDRGGTSFFVGRNMLSPSRDVGLPFWQDLIFIFLHKNASDPTVYYNIPINRVIEMGSRVEV
ncbi:potassium transporter Kup [Aquisediminimonas profunda]|uniref:potassium transporter Kup n=1 Tax=Aquisediminimonas profunda TaxID=1550733 RepID=UPI001FEC1F51|nr:potassium transporter Kup [Aquisediminimonas profunda]